MARFRARHPRSLTAATVAARGPDERKRSSVPRFRALARLRRAGGLHSGEPTPSTSIFPAPTPRPPALGKPRWASPTAPFREVGVIDGLRGRLRGVNGAGSPSRGEQILVSCAATIPGGTYAAFEQARRGRLEAKSKKLCAVLCALCASVVLRRMNGLGIKHPVGGRKIRNSKFEIRNPASLSASP